MTPADRRTDLVRLAAQGLTNRKARSAAEVVRHLLAVQAQDPRGARLAVRSRTTGLWPPTSMPRSTTARSS